MKVETKGCGYGLKSTFDLADVIYKPKARRCFKRLASSFRRRVSKKIRQDCENEALTGGLE